MSNPTRPPVTWKSLLDIALCDSLATDTRAIAANELRRLAEYVDDANYFEISSGLTLAPFNVGKPVSTEPSNGWGPAWLRELSR